MAFLQSRCSVTTKRTLQRGVIILLLAGSFLTITSAQINRTQIGVSGTWGSAGLYFYDDWYGYFSYPVARCGGIAVKQKISRRLVLTAGASLLRWNATFKEPRSLRGDVTIYQQHRSIYFPVTCHYYLGTSNKVYLIAGAAGSITLRNKIIRDIISSTDYQLTREDITAEMNLRKTDLYMITGLGFTQSLGKGFSIFVEPHYFFNLPNQSREWIGFDSRRAFFDNRQINIQAGIQKTLRS